MKKLKLSVALIAIAALSFTSCKKDDPKPPTLEYRQPAAAARSEIVEIPVGLTKKANAGDANALVAVSYMSLANVMSTYSTSFILPNGADRQSASENSVGYFWTNGAYSYWMTLNEESDKYVWTYDWQFPSTPRFTFIRSEESKDGKSGSWSIFDPDNKNQRIWTYSWSIDAQGNFMASLVWNDDSETNSFNIVDNKDGSGSFVYILDDIKQSEVQWKADGSGSYWMLDSNGESSGTWV